MAIVSDMVTIVTMEDAMSDLSKWEGQAKALLKSELKRRGVTYGQLVEKLETVGVSESEPNVRNKLSRGKFTAAFMMACLEAIDARELRL
ncbi:DUF6471 domain-containing protein [Maricaulis salignorans]|uniref:DUF6471 domain-containing protein n=1 Tax=Maricaulis salignorans TaxID=144026 RepID=UPI003A9392D6|tara:strand:+ start:67658 stop:67927 length:270 start_codon:yes stop_codon:yes gene_type:complete